MGSERPRPLCVSTGDPGGVGPEVALRGAEQALQDPIALFGDAGQLQRLAVDLGVERARLRLGDAGVLDRLRPGEIGLVGVGEAWGEEALRPEATAAGGRAQLAALDGALQAALSGQARALVTAPMSKAAVNLAGQSFVGHTEHLARAAGLADDDVTMMFLGPRLRVALVTTHLAVADVPKAITSARVERSVRHMAEVLLRFRGEGDRVRHLVVTGLNPHAGEQGLFGQEDRLVIQPVLERLRDQAPFATGEVALQGPAPAETALRLAASGQVDAVVTMMHDQATIASKLLDWTEAVNVTWGLPFVRTSVDHGVAYDARAADRVDPRGMQAAIRLAQRLTPR